MKIQYLGHSSFKLTDSAGVTIITDPYSPQIGFAMPKVSADAVTISHHHFDHDCAVAVDGNPQIVDRAENYNLNGVQINAFKSFHDNAKGKMRGENIIFKFRMDGLNVCHLGDLGEECSAELISRLLPVDVLLIPVGGNYTIDAETAQKYVQKLMPKVVIPMHYRVKDLKVDIEKLDEFTDLFNADAVKEYDGSEIELSPNDLSGNTKIIVLRRA